MSIITNPAFTRIAVELQPPVARVTLNNPPLNVIDIPMMEELRAALEQIETQPAISRDSLGRLRSRLLQRSGHRRPHSRQSP